MRYPATMPELQVNAPASVVHGRSHLPPAGHLVLGNLRVGHDDDRVPLVHEASRRPVRADRAGVGLGSAALVSVAPQIGSAFAVVGFAALIVTTGQLWLAVLAAGLLASGPYVVVRVMRALLTHTMPESPHHPART